MKHQQMLIVLTGLSIMIVACSQSNGQNLSLINATPSNTPTLTSPATTSDHKIISLKGIGPAKLGMKLGELKEILGPQAQYLIQSPYMVDFDAISVVQQGQVQYYLLYPAGTSLKDSDVIKQILTDNPDYQTAKGVGPGTLVQKAETLYGDATLRYNSAYEGREFVTFANEPTFNLSFRLGSAGDQSLAGIYSHSAGEFKETRQYRPDAKITSVLVDCRGLDCGEP